MDSLSLGGWENLEARAPAGVERVAIDVRDTDALREALRSHAPDGVIHLAAIHFIPRCEREPREALSVNVEGTRSLLEAAGDADSVAAILVASTAAVYAPACAPHSEDSTTGPTDIYGLTKLWSEQLAALTHTRTGKGIGIPRLFNVYGPGETNPHLIPAIAEQIKTTTELGLGNLSTRRDYVFVDDVATAMTALLDRVGSGEHLICNIGSEREVDGRTLVELIARALNRQVKVSIDPTRVRASDRPHLQSDCTLARDLLGWHARTDLEDGLRAMLDSPFAPSLAR